MELVNRAATFKGPEDWFAGEVWADVLYRARTVRSELGGDHDPIQEGSEAWPTSSSLACGP
jgi:hypothetical protein